MDDNGMERRGGLDVWAPSVTPPIGVELTDKQALACAFRILARAASPRTWPATSPGNARASQGCWSTRGACGGTRCTASDICAVDADGDVIAGQWDVTPAVHIHTELHRAPPRRPGRRPQPPVLRDACWPRSACCPRSCTRPRRMFDDELALRRRVHRRGRRRRARRRAGRADRRRRRSVILASHGVIVTGADDRGGDVPVGHASTACAGSPTTCMLLGPRRRFADRRRGCMKRHEGVAARAGADVFWDGAVRQLLRRRARRPRLMPDPESSRPRWPHASSTSCSPTPASPRPERGGDGHVPARPAAAPSARYTVISVDDHIVEPPDTFEGRMPAKFADRAPARRREATTAARSGSTTARSCPTSGSTPSSAGRSSEYGFEPTRFDEMRRGAWDIHARDRRHGPQRRLRVAVLPVVPARLRRPAPAAVDQGPRARPGRASGRGTTGTSRRGRAPYPDRIIPCQIP